MKIRFDTRDTKPRLRALLILTAAAAAAGLLSRFLANHRGLALCLVNAAWTLGAVLVLLWAFREQLRYNPYSYNTIYYLGFALFGVIVLITFILLAADMVREPEVYTETQVLHVLLGSAPAMPPPWWPTTLTTGSPWSRRWTGHITLNSTGMRSAVSAEEIR